jgi:hypothetical protein
MRLGNGKPSLGSCSVLFGDLHRRTTWRCRDKKVNALRKISGIFTNRESGSGPNGTKIRRFWDGVGGWLQVGELKLVALRRCCRRKLRRGFLQINQRVAPFFQSAAEPLIRNHAVQAMKAAWVMRIDNGICTGMEERVVHHSVNGWAVGDA